MNSVIEQLAQVEADSGNGNAAGEPGNGGSSAAVSDAAGQGAEGKQATAAEPDKGKPAGSDVQPAADGDPSSKAVVEDKPDAKSDKVVPLAALQEARDNVKQLKAQIDELKSQGTLSSEDRQLLADLKRQKTEADAAAAAAAKPKTPEFLEDPKGYIDAKAKEAAETVETLKKTAEQQQKQEQAREALNQVLTGIANHEAVFAKTTPDYKEAIDHMRNVRSSQLQMMYPKANSAQIAAAIQREEIQAAAQILQGGGNPVEFAYNYAKTMGYTPKAAPATNANGATPDKAAVKSLGSGGGGDKDDSDDSGDDGLGLLREAVAERFGKRKH